MNKIKKNIFNYSLLFILTLLFMYIYLGISNVDLYNPPVFLGDSVIFKGDTIFTYVVTKTYLTGETHLFGIPYSAHLGAPGIFSMADFPVFDGNLTIVMMKSIYTFCKNVWCAIYLYYFLTFFLVSFACFYVFKKFRISTPVAMSGALLFTFAPFHVQRNMWHLGYASYYLVPLMMLIVFWMWSKKPLFFKNTNNKWQFDLFNRKSIIALCTIALCGISNIYFDFFWMFFLTVATISAWYYRKNIYSVFSYLIIVVSNFLVVLANASPYIIYRFQYGQNIEAAGRLFARAEHYGLKIVQMILPVDNHFIFGKWKAFYNSHAMLVNENTSVTLGLIALIGFLFILFYFLFVRGKNFNLYNKCGLLIVSAIMLATVGGFSSFISLTMFSEIASYNRISIFISFMCVFVFAILLQKWLKHIKNKRIAMLLLVMITVIGIRDELPLWAVYRKDAIQKQKQYYGNLREFMKKVEDVNEEWGMIYQLPYVFFPESHYEQFKPYLVCDKLRFSFGAMRGRRVDAWIRETAMLKTPDMIKRLRETEFAGILINKNLYEADKRQDLIKDFDKYLKNKIENDEYVYYQL